MSSKTHFPYNAAGSESFLTSLNFRISLKKFPRGYRIQPGAVAFRTTTKKHWQGICPKSMQKDNLLQYHFFTPAPCTYLRNKCTEHLQSECDLHLAWKL
jgi:hypothetical protein